MTALTTYSSLLSGLNEYVRSLAVYTSGNLYAGGDFTTAGGVSANRIAKWNGSRWSALGTGLDNSVFSLAVDATGNLYAGGIFTSAGGVSANRIAKWDGSTWSALGTGLGTGLNDVVRSLAFDASGNLYAGGDFTIAGGVSANRIAKWNGSTWSALGTGLNDIVFSLAFDATGNLYAGGAFTSAGGFSANRIAKWNGSTWSALGTGFNNIIVYSLAVDVSGNLYAGGDFTVAGGFSANRIAKWNGSTWSALGTGLNDIVFSLAFDASGNLYAGGYFTTAGGVSANRIAKWNGSTWSALGTGLNNSVNSLAFEASGFLYAGGIFTTAGGGVSANYVCKLNTALSSGFVVNNGYYTNNDLINIFAPLKPSCDYGTFDLNYTTSLVIDTWNYLYNTINNVKVNAFTKNSTADVVSIGISSNKSYFRFTEPGIYNLKLTLRLISIADPGSSGVNFGLFLRILSSSDLDLDYYNISYGGNCSDGNGFSSLQDNNLVYIQRNSSNAGYPVMYILFAVTSAGIAYPNEYCMDITFKVPEGTDNDNPYTLFPSLYSNFTVLVNLNNVKFNGNWVVDKVV